MGWATRIIEKLQAGETVSFRPTGNSMTPHIKSGQLVTVTPYAAGEVPEPGSIVLAKVHGNQYLHFARSVQGCQVQIVNARGRVNGWTKFSNVYGKVTALAE